MAGLLVLLLGTFPGSVESAGENQPAVGIPRGSAGRPLWQPAVWDNFPVRIVLSDRAALDRLLEEIPLHDFHREQIVPAPRHDGRAGIILETRVTADEFRALIGKGYQCRRLPDREKILRQEIEEDWSRSWAKSGAELLAGPLDYYPTHAQIGAMLAQLALDYPDHCRTFSWGQSVEGRELWGLVVSADPNESTAEPEVRLSSTMHGNETPGMVMLLNLAEYLVTNYGQTGYQDVTDLVDGYEIHILPLHNPDGYVAGTRTNANGVDLNRNFPAPSPIHPTQELENVHFMAYAEANHFVISQNGHSGALVVNYPWDFQFALTPDDAAIINLSLEYASHNLPMTNGLFNQGITNGAVWYVVNGSIQDWSYYATGCIDLTVELSNIKWPAASSLGSLWDDNRESLLHFIRAARFGVNGVVTDASSGQPLDATITVTGNAKAVATDPDHGDYYKLLDTGTYELTFAAAGYFPQTISGVTTSWGGATVLNVALVAEVSGVPWRPAAGAFIAAAPNPFNPRTVLTFDPVVAGRASVVIFDGRGRVVRSLHDGLLPGGPSTLVWDGLTDAGLQVPSGVYFARLDSGERKASVKVALVR